VVGDHRPLHSCGFSRLQSLPPPLAQRRVVARLRDARNAAGLRDYGARIIMSEQHLADQAGGELRGPAKPDLPLPRDLHPSGAALQQQVALELGQDGQDTHDHLSGRGARVDVVHQGHELRALALDLFRNLQEVKLGPGEAIQAVDGGLIPRPEQVEHPPKLTAIPFGSGCLLAEDVAVVHASLGQGLKLKRPIMIRGGDARVAEPASHRAKTMCRRCEFSHGLFARQVPPETVVQAAVQKLLSFWTAPSLIVLPPCLLIRGRTEWRRGAA
jgi:hypothetical protein